MLLNPPPSRCEYCGSDPAPWESLDGSERLVRLGDGREVARRGRGHLCRTCGHLEPVGSEGIQQGTMEFRQR